MLADHNHIGIHWALSLLVRRVRHKSNKQTNKYINLLAARTPRNKIMLKLTDWTSYITPLPWVTYTQFLKQHDILLFYFCLFYLLVISLLYPSSREPRLFFLPSSILFSQQSCDVGWERMSAHPHLLKLIVWMSELIVWMSEKNQTVEFERLALSGLWFTYDKAISFQTFSSRFLPFISIAFIFL